MAQQPVGLVQPLAANPLGGGATQSLAEGILQRPPGVMDVVLQQCQVEGLIEVGVDLGDQRLEGIPVEQLFRFHLGCGVV